MNLSLDVSASFYCESCRLAKHHRVPYPVSHNKIVSTPFEFVHSEVWKPCPIESIMDFKYFVTLIDDYSRVTFVYMIKNCPNYLKFGTIFMPKSKYNLVFRLNAFKVTMVLSIYPMSSILICPTMHHPPNFLSLHTATEWYGRGQESPS